MSRVVLIAFLTTACASAPGPERTPDPEVEPTGDERVYLPIYRPMSSVPEALLGGLLIEADGCLWMEGPDGSRALPLWPPGSTLEADGATRFVRNGVARAILGTRTSGGGGEYGPENYEFIVDLIGEEIPPACRGDGRYWLVYDVRTVEP